MPSATIISLTTHRPVVDYEVIPAPEPERGGNCLVSALLLAIGMVMGGGLVAMAWWL